MLVHRMTSRASDRASIGSSQTIMSQSFYENYRRYEKQSIPSPSQNYDIDSKLCIYVCVYVCVCACMHIRHA